MDYCGLYLQIKCLVRTTVICTATLCNNVIIFYTHVIKIQMVMMMLMMLMTPHFYQIGDSMGHHGRQAAALQSALHQPAR